MGILAKKYLDVTLPRRNRISSESISARSHPNSSYISVPSSSLRPTNYRAATGLASSTSCDSGDEDDVAPKVLICCKCRTHLTTMDELISKNFQGSHGRAWLFNQVVNVELGVPEVRSMTTGYHSVSDIKCIECQTVVGWKYHKAFNEDQRYKEGKVIIEKAFFTELKEDTESAHSSWTQQWLQCEER